MRATEQFIRLINERYQLRSPLENQKLSFTVVVMSDKPARSQVQGLASIYGNICHSILLNGLYRWCLQSCANSRRATKLAMARARFGSLGQTRLNAMHNYVCRLWRGGREIYPKLGADAVKRERYGDALRIHSYLPWFSVTLEPNDAPGE